MARAQLTPGTWIGLAALAAAIAVSVLGAGRPGRRQL